MVFGLALEPVKSSLHNITCKEKYNFKLLNKLINSSLLLKDPWNNFENEKEQLLKYIKTKGTVKYRRTGSFGRTFCYHSAGLQSLRKEIRHTIAKEFHVEIDIVNCHPEVLNQILKLNGFNGGVCLHKYVKDREYYLNEVMNKYQVDRDTAKSLFIRVLYGGSWLSWAKQNKLDTNVKYDFIEQLQNEMNDINQTISVSNPRIREVVDKQRPNFDATITALYLQEIENRILEKVFNYCVDKGYVLHNACVLCFDGLMLLKDSFKEELLQELNTFISLTFSWILNLYKKKWITASQKNKLKIAKSVN